MEAIGYCRVSTTLQGEDGVSLETQEAKIRAQAAILEAHFARIDHEIGSGAAIYRRSPRCKSNPRPLAAAILDEIRQGKGPDALIVYALDRLTRDLGDLSAILKLCEHKKCRIVSVSETIDTSTAAGRAMVHMIGVFAQWQREYIGERTRDVLRGMRKNGSRVNAISTRGMSRVQYGWEIDPDSEVNVDSGLPMGLRENAQEQENIRRVLELREEGIGLRMIGKRLAAEGRLCRGHPWHSSLLSKIVRKHAR